MSDTPKRPYRQVRAVADKVLERFAPGCTRIALAGSLRREKPLIGDIEIVAIPRFERPTLGAQCGWSEVDKLLAQFEASGGLHIRKGAKNRGHERKYVQFTFTVNAGLYVVDLFLQPDPATWGCNYLVRTGSAEFSQRMVTPQSQGGYKPAGFAIEGARVWQDGVALDTPDEEDIFALWDMDPVDPKERN